MDKKVLFFSDKYRVTAMENGEKSNVPVHKTLTGECTKHFAENISDELFEIYNFPSRTCRTHTRRTYYAAYTFAERVSLEITLPEGTKNVEIKPEAARGHVTLDGERVLVETDGTLYLVIYPDGDIFGGLRVLLDKQRERPTGFENEIIFTEGVYTADNCEHIRISENGTPIIDGIADNTLIWIDKNAAVNAAIELKGVRNVTVAGTGILTLVDRCHGADEDLAADGYWGLFRTGAMANITVRSGCEGIVVDGPLLDCEFRGIVLRNSDGIEVRNVKMFTSTHNADGINCYNTRSLLVESCFIQSQDDAFCMYNSCDSIPWLNDEGFSDVLPVCRDVEVRDCTIFTNCRPVVLGGHATGATEPRCLIERVNIHDCSIIETPVKLFIATERFAYFWSSVFRILSQSEQIVRDINFENITVEVTEGYGGKIFHLHVRSNEETSYTESRGFCIEDITFKNIEILGSTDALYPSVIKCREKDADEAQSPYIKGVRFENVTVGGKPLTEELFRIEGTVL